MGCAPTRDDRMACALAQDDRGRKTPNRVQNNTVIRILRPPPILQAQAGQRAPIGTHHHAAYRRVDEAGERGRHRRGGGHGGAGRGVLRLAALAQDDRMGCMLAQDDRMGCAPTQDDRMGSMLAQDDRMGCAPARDDSITCTPAHRSSIGTQSRATGPVYT